MTVTRNPVWAKWAVFPVLVLALAACGSTSSNDPAPSTDGQIRVVHATADAPPVDVYVEGLPGPVFTLSYGETSEFAPLPAGDYNFQVFASGADPEADAPVYETGLLSIMDTDVITAVAAGSLAALPGAPEAFRVLPLFHDFVPAAPGNALVRILHAGANAPTVAIDVGDDGAAEISGLALFADTGEAGIPLPSGQELRIGIQDDASSTRVLGFGTPQLPDGAELFVIATGLLGKGPREDDAFTLLVVGPSGTVGLLPQDPWVYALHLSPDTGPVDIVVQGQATPLISNLPFGGPLGTMAPVNVPPGTYTLEVQSAGSGTPALTFTTPALAAGQAYLVGVTGYSSPGIGRPALAALPIQDALEGSDATLEGQLRAVHAGSDAPPVDIGPVSMVGMVPQVSPLPGWTNLSLGDLSTPPEGTLVPVTPIVVGVAATGTSLPLLSFNVDIDPTTRAYAIVAGTVFSLVFPSDATVRLLVVATEAWPWQLAEINPIP